MTIRRTTALALAFALALGMLAFATSNASAATTQARLAYVNGTSADPVDITVNGGPAVSGVPFSDSWQPSEGVESGQFDIAYSDGSALSVAIDAEHAYTVVSGFGDGGNTAFAYNSPIAEIPDGQAVVVVWNAMTIEAGITVNGEASIVQPGDAHPGSPMAVDAGSTISIDVDGVTEDVVPQADQYIDVFGVNDGASTGIAQSIIPSMQALVDAINTDPPIVPDPTVPDVNGQSAADGEAALIAAGYNVGTQEQASDDVEEGIVISTNPAGGTELAQGETVTMVVSTGSATSSVPDVVGLPADEAQAALEDAGFVVQTTEQASDDVEEGLVIETNPSAGIDVAPGSTVTMTVSTGPDDVIVPDFVGMTIDEATAAAEAVGLTAVFLVDEDDPDPEGVVLDQMPAAGETVPAGSEVSLQLSPATKDAWAILEVTPDRILVITGINFLPDSVTESSVLRTAFSSQAIVEASGYWTSSIDISMLSDDAYELLVTGTAEDGSAYEQVFAIPEVGETVEQVVGAVQINNDTTGWWAVLIALIVVAAILGIALVWYHAKNPDDGGDAAAADVAGAGTAAADGGDSAPTDDAATGTEATDTTDSGSGSATDDASGDGGTD